MSPPRQGNPTVQIRLAPEVRAEWESLATREGWTLPQMARVAVAALISQCQTDDDPAPRRVCELCRGTAVES